jgi:hypothetical protein
MNTDERYRPDKNIAVAVTNKLLPPFAIHPALTSSNGSPSISIVQNSVFLGLCIIGLLNKVNVSFVDQLYKD